MYCPSCEQSFGSTFSRCPECHCWLKQNGPAVTAATATAPIATGVNATGWQQPVEEPAIESAANLPTDELVADQDWAHPSSMQQADAPVDGWSSKNFPGTDEEDDWGTPYQSGELKKAKPAPTDDDWVEDEIENADFPASGDTEYVPDYRPEATVNNTKTMIAAGIAAMFVCLLGIVLFKGSGTPKPTDTPTQSSAQILQQEAMENAELWMGSAAESMNGKDYELAQAQLKKAVEFLEDGGAEASDIRAAQILLAEAMSADGKLQAAHKQLQRLSPAPTEQVNELEKKLRQKANKLMEKAKTALNSEPEKTIELAEGAARLYARYGGQRAQEADAQELMGKAHIKLKNRPAAAQSYSRAVDLQPTAERRKTLASLAPKNQRKKRNGTAKRSNRPTFDLGHSNVPKAAPREVEDPNLNLQDQANNRPIDVNTDPDNEVPVEPPSYQRKAERRGDENVLPTYNNNSSKSGPPGYR